MPLIRGSRRWPGSSRSPPSPPPSANPGTSPPRLPPQGAPRPRRPRQMGRSVHHRQHPRHDRGRVRQSLRPRPVPGRQRIFLVDGNKQQITAIKACAKDRDLNVPVFIDDIYVNGYIGKAAAALHPGGPQAAREWADGQLLRILHGRAKAVAATLASVAARTRAKASTRHLDLTDVDKAVTYLTNNHMHMHYDKALAAGVADRHRHDRGSLPLRHRRQIRNHRRQ